MASYLIPYVDPRKIEGHEDPMFEEFTYGDSGRRGKILEEKVKVGDYLFFHTSRRGKRVITAYYVVEKVMPTNKAKEDPLIISKYKNPHLHYEGTYNNDTIVFGNPIYSRVLKRPLILNREILSKLKKPLRLNPKQTELAAISSALRNWKKLDDEDVKFLLKCIEENDKQNILKDRFLATYEIEQLDEEDIEKFVSDNPRILGDNMKFFKRQYVLKSGKRVDLLLKVKDKNDLVVVEIKKGAIGKEAYKQVKEYIKEVREKFKCNVRGILICRDILPAFEDFFINRIERGEINIYLYGWKFNLRPLLSDVEKWF